MSANSLLMAPFEDYDAWKIRMKNAKMEREKAKSLNPHPEPPLNFSPFGKTVIPSISDEEDECKGTFVVLPTIPPMRVIVERNGKYLVSTKKCRIPFPHKGQRTFPASISTFSSSSLPREPNLLALSPTTSSTLSSTPLHSTAPSSSSSSS
ncbi:hypothetical protein PMAYCL1PPCAC_28937, partial [Pristionchus mayeri]